MYVTRLTLTLLMVSGPVVALGDTPHLGGPMKHILVSQQGMALLATLEGDPNEVLVLQRYDETYGPPAEVLNDTAYNGQYGWLASGFFNLPPNSGVWVELLEQTPGLSTYQQGDFAPIFTTAGSSSIWRWNGTMVHNWYAVLDCGMYEARYEIYVGDNAGNRLSEYQPATIRLRWIEPSLPVGDLNADGQVDLSDLSLLLVHFGETGATPEEGDLSGDGIVDLTDLSMLLVSFGQTCV